MEDRAVPGWMGLAVGAATAAAVTTIAFWLEIYIWLKEAKELAAWVQAIGSVAAIVAATAISSREAKHARLLQRDERAEAHIERLNAIIGIADEAVLLSCEVEQSELWFGESYSRELFDEIDGAISTIPLHELRSTTVVKAVLKLKRAHKEAIGITERYVAGYRSEREEGVYWNQPDAFEQLQRVREGLREARDALVNFANDINDAK